MKTREKENNIPWQNATKIKEITKTKNKTQMRTKNNTNQQIIPTHNTDNKNWDIADKREYEVNLIRSTSSETSFASEKPEKSSDKIINACQKRRDHMKRPEKEITLFSPTTKRNEE